MSLTQNITLTLATPVGNGPSMKSTSPAKDRPNQSKEVVGIDLGNTWVRIAYNFKEYLIYNSLFLQNGNVYVNKRPSPLCVIDTVSLVGRKYQDSEFQKIVKYYNLTFKKGTNKNILVESNNSSFQGEFYMELPFALFLKGIFQTNAVIRFLNNNLKPIKHIVTVFEGKLNPYRHALTQSLKISGARQSFLVNTALCIVTAYLRTSKKEKDSSEVIGVIDFGSQGLTFSAFKLYSIEPGIVETLYYQISQNGGISLTHLLVDYIVTQLIKEKGMDISKDQMLMSKLKVLCDEAKHILSSHDKAFIRLDGLPDILVYGCQISVRQFEKCIEEPVRQNIEMIVKAIKARKEKPSKIFLTGGSYKIPLFRRLLEKEAQIPLVECPGQWIQRGLILVKSEQIKILDICPFDLKLEGDEKVSAHLVRKGEPIPLRKRQMLTFPSGELNFSLKFYQNQQLVCSCFIPERPRENRFSLFVEVDHNKMLKVFATTTQGLIKMTVNMIEIPREEYIRYEEKLNKSDFHFDNQ